MKLSLVVSLPDVVYGPLALLSGAFEEKLDKAAGLGCQGVELMTRDPARLDGAAIAAALRRRNLEVSQVVTGELFGADGLGLVTSDEDLAARSLQRGKEVVDFATRWGALVNVGRFRGRLDWVKDRPDRYAYALERIGLLADYAGERGVRIALEPLIRYECDFIHSSQDGLRFIRDLGRDNVGLMLDLFHMNVEDASIEGSFREAAPKAWHVHLADNNRRPCGQGYLNLASIFATLREIGYQGYVSAEHLPLPDPDTAAALTIRHVQQYL
jgi:sugar phosphate isomerase/epimerase